MTHQVVSVGEQIKPQIELDDAARLAERLYGIKVDTALELDGYDDKNYHLQVSEAPSNKYITQLWPGGYLMKITNSSDSKKPEFLEAQCELMMHLHKKGVKTPQPQRTTDGKLFCIETFENKDGTGNNTSKQHAIRLLSFQVGTLMKEIPWTYDLHYKVGRCTAHLDLVLKDFSHPAYTNYSSLWLIESMPLIEKYLFAVEDEKKCCLIKDVIEDFKTSVLSRITSLKSGMIHGDINEGNLLGQQNDEGEWEVSAVLDLGDSHLSAYVLELALTMTYMMLQSGEVQSGQYVAAGYLSLHALPRDELRLLKISYSCRNEANGVAVEDQLGCSASDSMLVLPLSEDSVLFPAQYGMHMCPSLPEPSVRPVHTLTGALQQLRTEHAEARRMAVVGDSLGHRHSTVREHMARRPASRTMTQPTG